jgi:hypothetical protein
METYRIFLTAVLGMQAVRAGIAKAGTLAILWKILKPSTLKMCVFYVRLHYKYNLNE